MIPSQWSKKREAPVEVPDEDIVKAVESLDEAPEEFSIPDDAPKPKKKSAKKKSSE